MFVRLAIGRPGEGAQGEEWEEEKRGACLDEILCVMSLRVDLD